MKLWSWSRVLNSFFKSQKLSWTKTIQVIMWIWVFQIPLVSTQLVTKAVYSCLHPLQGNGAGSTDEGCTVFGAGNFKREDKWEKSTKINRIKNSCHTWKELGLPTFLTSENLSSVNFSRLTAGTYWARSSADIECLITDNEGFNSTQAAILNKIHFVCLL